MSGVETERRLRPWRQSGCWETLCVMGVSVGLSVILTWPLAAHLGSALPGPPGKTDSPQYMWGMWWATTPWRTWFPNPLRCDYLFYPLGTPLSHHVCVLYYALIGLPFILVFGVVTAFNLVILSTFVSSSVACYWLARVLGIERRGAWVAALLFSFSSYRLWRMTQHLDMLKGDLFAVYALCLMWLLTGRHWKRAGLCAGIVFAACFYASVLGAVHLLFLSTLFVVFFFKPRRLPAATRRMIGGLSIAGLVCLFLTAPYLYQYNSTQNSGNYYLAGDHLRYAADLLGFLRPPAGSHLWGRSANQCFAWRHAVQEGSVFLGLLTLPFLAVGVFHRGRDTRLAFWRTAFFVFLVLSLGPLLKVNGQTKFLAGVFGNEGISLPLPGALFAYVPVLRDFRAATRLHEMTTLPFALLVGSGFCVATRVRSLRRAAAPVTVAFVTLCLMEAATCPIAVSPVHGEALSAIRDDPEDVTVLDQEAGMRGPMLDQTIHGKRMATGWISRTPPECLGYLRSTPLLRELCTRGEAPEWIPVDAEVKANWAAMASTLKQRPDCAKMVRNVVDLLNLRYLIIKEPYEDYRRVFFDGLFPCETLSEANGAGVYRLDVPRLTGLRPRQIVVGDAEWSAYLGHGWGQWRRNIETVQGGDAIWPTLPRSTVLFRTDDARPVHFACDTYLPESCPGVRIRLTANGQASGEVDVPPGFARVEWDLEPDWIRPGLNEISIAWPYPGGRYTWMPGGAIYPDIVVMSGAAGRSFVNSSIEINGQTRYEGERGYSIVQLSRDGHRVVRSGNWDPYEEPDAWSQMTAYIRGIPDGTLVAFLSANEPSCGITGDAVAALSALGSAFDMTGKKFWCHAGIGIKGAAPGAALESYSGESSISLAPGRCAFLAFRFQ